MFSPWICWSKRSQAQAADCDALAGEAKVRNVEMWKCMKCTLIGMVGQCSDLMISLFFFGGAEHDLMLAKTITTSPNFATVCAICHPSLLLQKQARRVVAPKERDTTALASEGSSSAPFKCSPSESYPYSRGSQTCSQNDGSRKGHHPMHVLCIWFM